MAEEPSDEQLLDCYFEGDSLCFNIFFRRHSHRVVRYAMKMGLSEADASDAAQESFLKLHRQIHDYQRGRKALPWFFAIVHNTCLTHHRSEKRRLTRETKASSEWLGAGEVSNDYREGISGLDDETRAFPVENAVLLGGLAQLKKGERSLLEDRLVNAKPYKEIALSTGKSEASLRKIFERAISQLKKLSKGELK